MYLEPYEIIYIVLEAFCGSLGLIGNFLVILVFIRRSVQKPPAVILILSLAIGDFAYSLFSSPLQATAQAYPASYGNESLAENHHIEDILCKVTMAVDLGIEYYSIVVHGLITVNRYCVVCRRAQRAMTTRATITAVIVIILISLVIGGLGGMTSSINYSYDTVNCIVVQFYGFIAIFFVTLVGTVLLIVVLNLKMVLHVRNEQRKIWPDIHHRVDETNAGNAGRDKSWQLHADVASRRDIAMSSSMASHGDTIETITATTSVDAASHLAVPTTNAKSVGMDKSWRPNADVVSPRDIAMFSFMASNGDTIETVTATTSVDAASHLTVPKTNAENDDMDKSWQPNADVVSPCDIVISSSMASNGDMIEPVTATTLVDAACYLTVPTTSIDAASHLTVPTTSVDAVSHLTVPTTSIDAASHLTVPTMSVGAASHLTVPTTSVDAASHLTVPTTSGDAACHLKVPTRRVNAALHLTVPTISKRRLAFEQPTPTVSQDQQHQLIEPRRQPQYRQPKPRANASNNQREFQRKTLSKMTKTLILSTTIFALLWILAFGAFIVPLDTLQHLKYNNRHTFAFVIFATELIRFNHVINPVIYGFMCSRFKVEFKRLFRRA